MSKMTHSIVILAYAYIEVASWSNSTGRHSVIQRTVDYKSITWC
jgi:hypothetical protein